MRTLMFIGLGIGAFVLTGLLIKHFRQRYMTNWHAAWSLAAGYALVFPIGGIAGWAFAMADWNTRLVSILLSLYTISQWKGGKDPKQPGKGDAVALATVLAAYGAAFMIYRAAPWS